MAEAMNTSVVSSNLYNQNKCDLRTSECSNCVLLEDQLHSALVELESAKLIIKLYKRKVTKTSLMVKEPVRQLTHLEI